MPTQQQTPAASSGTNSGLSASSRRNSGGFVNPPPTTGQQQADYMRPWEPQTVTFSKPIITFQPHRAEAIVMLFAMLIIAIFELSAALTPVFTMSESGTTDVTKLTFTVYHHKLRICTSSTATTIAAASFGCYDESFPGKLCDDLTSRLTAAQGFAVAAMIVGILGIINGVLEYQGKAFMTPLVTYIVGGVAWLLLLLHWGLDSGAYNEHLCRGQSLKGLGFAYKAGWVLGFVAWLFLSLCFVFYFIRRRMQPVVYKFHSADYQG